MDKIVIKNLYKDFDGRNILSDISLSIKEGESLVIIGNSGSGKSTLMRNIAMLDKPNKGEIFVDDKDITKMNDEESYQMREKMGVAFQNSALFDSIKIWENIMFHSIYASKSKKTAKELKEKAVDLLKNVGIGSHVIDLYPSQISGGMKKRVAFARAVATNPEILFFDEPTAGLDPIMANIITETIRNCSKSPNTTTITISHDMESVKKMADKVAFIFDGKMVWYGAVGNIENSNNEFVDQFINGRIDGPIKMV